MTIEKVLVTGGAGFIGSAVVRHIIETTELTVVNVDKLTYAANLSSLASVAGSPRYTFERADICDGTQMSALLASHRPDAIMHLAAESHVDRSIDGPAPPTHCQRPRHAPLGPSIASRFRINRCPGQRLR